VTEQLGVDHPQLSEGSLDVGEWTIIVNMLLLFCMDVIIGMKDNQIFMHHLCGVGTSLQIWQVID